MNLSGKQQMAAGLVAAVALVRAMAARGPSQTPLLQRSPAPLSPWLATGSQAPELRLASVQADSLRSEVLRGGESVLVFVTPQCPYCQQLKQELLARELPDLEGRLVFVTSSVPDSSASAEILDLELRLAAVYPVAVDNAGAAFEAYQARSVPTTYLIDGEGRVAGSADGPQNGLSLIEGFVERRAQVRLAALEADR